MERQFGTQFNISAVFTENFSSYGSNLNYVGGFLIENFCRNGELDSAVEALVCMCALGASVPPFAVCIILSACVDTNRVHVILDIYGKLCGQGFGVYEFVMSRLLGKGVKDFFDVLLRVGPEPNVVTFSTMINTYGKDRRLEEAIKLYEVMKEKGISPDLVVYSILIDSLFKAGKLEEGHRLFSVALDSGIKLDVVIFSSVMDAYVRTRNLEKLVEMYRRMYNEGISQNTVSYSVLINGLCYKFCFFVVSEREREREKRKKKLINKQMDKNALLNGGNGHMYQSSVGQRTSGTVLMFFFVRYQKL
ncbi:putative pentatricopeptide [Rosa chinensis]|uniref:Putative pentatricopeptide n=1 Tax=Rosa chinensis TaxID=74649 RepID=A0A2P6RX34_ROSCH|nr:putative pentatricopeptide [Rosa chinensis]